MKKEILLLSSLISLSLIFYLSIPLNENMDHRDIVENEILEREANNLLDDKLKQDPSVKFDIVRLDLKGNIIIAGKTIPDVEVQIFDGNEKLSTVISDSHGDWVWVSENQIEDGLKRFHLKYVDKSGEEHNSIENVIVNFEKDNADNHKIFKVSEDSRKGVKVLNEKEIIGIAIDSVEHFNNGNLRIRGRSVPLSKIKIFLSENILSETFVKKDGFWEINLKNIELGRYDLKFELISQNQVISLETTIFNGLINSELLQKKKIIVEDGNSLWRIARKTLGGWVLYAEIYKHNRKKIKDPNLIYPGQVFNIPNIKKEISYE
jgi:hypothetical protein